MKYEIHGTTLPILTITMEKNEAVYSRSGALVDIADKTDISTRPLGGLAKSLRRIAGKETAFMMVFKATEDGCWASFSEGKVPGATRAVTITQEKDLICERASFLCAELGVDMDIAFIRRISAGLFGGGGFIFLRLSGEGTAFLHPFGEIREHTLADGEHLLAAFGKVVAFESTVDYQVTFMRKLQNIFFSNEGFFLVKLTGPGKVYLQSTTSLVTLPSPQTI